MSRFTKKTTHRLKQAGWHVNRRVDISHKIKIMGDLDYHLTPPMVNFLVEFDNLSLTYSDGSCLFDFITHDTAFLPELCMLRNGLVGEDTMLIGYFCNTDYVLLITKDKKMYCYDEFENVYKIGDYYDEGIEFICTHGLNPMNHLKNIKI